MESTVTFTVNGRQRTVVTDSARPLLDVLREEFTLTGPKYGCGEGRCGACTVLVDGKHEHSCLMPITDAGGKQVTTIEGLAPAGNRLHPVQQAFILENAAQCGFCTQGMIMAAVALLRAKPHPTDEEIIAWMNGNVCRCCSYPRILQAIRRAADHETANPAIPSGAPGANGK